MNFPARQGFRITMTLAARIITVSEAIKNIFAWEGVPLEKMAVIPNGVDVAPFDAPFDAAAFRIRHNIPLDALVIAAVGRLSREKGFDILIRTFDMLQGGEDPDVFQIRTDADIHLVIVGDGPEFRALQRNTRYNSWIHLAGKVSDAVPYFQMADIIAVPSRQEGQGIVALEAMAARNPLWQAESED